MCYVGCRYEYTGGDALGECWLADDAEIPRDAMCRIDDLSIEHDRIKAENAKLRDFANLLWLIVSHESSFVLAELIDEARGLGIEVELCE